MLLPKEIEALQNLEELNLRFCSLTSLPDEIINLPYLQNLALDGNDLINFPTVATRCMSLMNLSLADKQLTTIPSEISSLVYLEVLDLSDNRIFKLPNELKQLTRLKHLDLARNPIGIPPEVISKTSEPQSILNYYFSVGKQRGRPINEIKLLLVGQGSVGKTSLVQQILFGTFDQNQTKTEGISINQWQIEGSTNRESDLSLAIYDPPVHINIWDFGGQEIMHATHQFFLTRRSLYMLVLDSRLTQDENRVEYWLKIIQSFGGESPVLIIGNKIDQHPLDIDRTGLQKNIRILLAFSKHLPPLVRAS